MQLARHVKAVSSRSRRSHAVTDCSLRRLMVSDTPPELRAALPRRQEASSLRNGIFLAAISANRKFLRNQVLDNQRSFKVDDVAALPYAALPMPTHRARSPRTCITSPAPCLAGFARDAVGSPGRRAEGQNHLDITATGGVEGGGAEANSERILMASRRTEAHGGPR